MVLIKAAFQDFSEAQATESGKTVVLEVGTGGTLVVPGGDMLLVADFVRDGSDLLLVGPDGWQVLIKGYFSAEAPPALATESGGVLSSELVARLAGPLAPGQYAQIGSADAAPSIGTVETVDGVVTATRVDGTQVTLTVDSPVFQGDVLETVGRSAIGIVFNDDTRFSLGADARIVT